MCLSHQSTRTHITKRHTHTYTYTYTLADRQHLHAQCPYTLSHESHGCGIISIPFEPCSPERGAWPTTKLTAQYRLAQYALVGPTNSGHKTPSRNGRIQTVQALQPMMASLLCDRLVERPCSPQNPNAKTSELANDKTSADPNRSITAHLSAVLQSRISDLAMLLLLRFSFTHTRFLSFSLPLSAAHCIFLLFFHLLDISSSGSVHTESSTGPGYTKTQHATMTFA